MISTILRYKAHTEKRPQMKCLKDLCCEEVAYNAIYKLAFDMTVNFQQVVSKSETEVCLSDNPGFSLFAVEHSFRDYGSEELYAFHHLTIQEYLAAHYLHVAGVDSLKVRFVSPHLKNVWKFYCGLAESAGIHFIKYLLTKISFRLLFKIQCAFESEKVL